MKDMRSDVGSSVLVQHNVMRVMNLGIGDSLSALKNCVGLVEK